MTRWPASTQRLFCTQPDGSILLVAFRKNSDSRPQITDVTPLAAIPGGEFRIRGKGLTGPAVRPRVRLGDTPVPIVIGSDQLLIVRVPEGASRGQLVLGEDDAAWA